MSRTKLKGSLLVTLALLLLPPAYARPAERPADALRTGTNTELLVPMVMDDFHDLQFRFLVFYAYGPSRYGGAFTAVQWGDRTVARFPIQGTVFIAFLAGGVALCILIILGFLTRRPRLCSAN